MRNLKRALSLALASVMLLGMMVVGTSAASYPDVSAEDNVEAIEVLNAVKVMVGDRGNFRPDAAVNRHEMAAIMARLVLGEDAETYVGSHPFTDVYPWADKYVAACYENGLINGTSKTTFSGNQPLTAVQAAAMMLRALGYENLQKGASDWRVPVTAKANEIRLFKGVASSPNAQLTRNQVAQLALNTLKSDVVVADIEQDIIVEGVVTIPGKTTYNKVEANAVGYTSDPDTSCNDYKYQQLCEKLYENDLKLTEDTDDMGRPANVWSYKNDEIVKAAKEADRVIVVDKAQTLAKEIEDANKNWKLSWNDGSAKTTTVTVNGGASASSVKVGDVLEIYMDGDTANAISTIAITQYSMDEVTGAVATKGSGDDLEVRIPGFVGYTKADKLNGNYTDLEKDDIIYYYQDSEGVYTFAKADSFEGTYSGDKTGTPTKHIVDGKNYVDNGNTGALSLTKQTSYTFYTDANGYLIAAKEIEEATGDYVVIQELKFAAGTGGITGSQAVEARLVKMDGTVEVVKVKSVDVGGTVYKDIKSGADASALVQNTGTTADVADAVEALVCDGTGTAPAFFTYSVNSDKEYELKQVVADPADKLTVGELDATNTIGNKDAVIAGSGPAVNRNTVFVVATEDGGKSFKVYNGINEVPDITPKAQGGTYVAKNGIATYVYVGHWSANSMDGDTVFFLKDSPEEKLSRKSGDDTIYYNTYMAIVNGEYKLVEVKAASNGSDSLDGGSASVAVELFTPTYNSDNLITKLVASAKDEAKIGWTMDGGVLKAGNKAYTCADDALVFTMDEDDNVTAGAAADIDGNDDVNDSVYVVKTASDKDVVDFLVIIENPGETAEEAAEEAVSDVIGSTEWAHKDGKPAYTPVGTFEISGNTITASGYNTEADMARGLDDTPRFLASLYKDGKGVTEIQYKSGANWKTYSWNTNVSATSKWEENGGGDTDTLVKVIVNDMKTKLGVTGGDGTWTVPDGGIPAQDVTIPLKLNGVEYNYVIKVPAFADPTP